MPLAGWCRECGDWVWVQDDGGCPAGHAADSVAAHVAIAKPPSWLTLTLH